jgi:hypothetical protein
MSAGGAGSVTQLSDMGTMLQQQRTTWYAVLPLTGKPGTQLAGVAPHMIIHGP